MTRSTLIRLAHSPDSDDAFMFCGLATGQVPTPGLEWEHVLADIETLNRRAAEGAYEVTALSVHAYGRLHDGYRLMSAGASMGEGYGPLVVAREGSGAGADGRGGLDGLVVAVPGTRTSAYLALRLHSPDVQTKVVPFDRIGEAVLSGEVDAGVLIHEGQLTWRDEGLRRLVDLGRWWADRTGLPLPLGANAVRRDLPGALQRRLAAAVRDSVRWGLENREAALAHAQSYARGMDRDRADRFVGMYVNERTIDCGPDGRYAMRLFLKMGHDAGLLPEAVEPDFLD